MKHFFSVNLLKKIALSSAFSLLIFSTSPAFSAEENSLTTLAELTSTISYMEVKISDFIELQKSLNPSFNKNVSPSDIFKSFYTYIDLNVIGAGKKVTLFPDKVITYVSDNIQEGKTSDQISLLLIEEYKKGTFSFSDEQENDDLAELKKHPLKTQFGAFFAAQAEYDQKPDGTFHPLMEINQAKIFFSSNISLENDNKNQMYFLAEWNPVPEEVMHHIESLEFDNNGKKQILKSPDQTIEAGKDIPFEQLYVNMGNLFGSGIDVTLGQFRNPFGFWSDYTSHRNISSAKNNMLVNGFALKKLELGLLLEKNFNKLPFDSTLSLKAALVHGRLTRTFPLSREDNDDDKDLVGQIEFLNERFSIGASAYLGSMTVNKNVAYGANFFIPTKYVSFSGEYVYQQNNNINDTFKAFVESGNSLIVTQDKFNFTSSSSHSGYLQFDYHVQDTFSCMKSPAIDFLTRDLHLYGMYDIWSYYTDGKIYRHPTYKVFHGLRYQINKNARWTIVEYGRMFYEDFSKDFHTLTSQFEVTF